MERIRIQSQRCKIGGRVFNAGRIVEVEALTARALVLAGSAAYIGDTGGERTRATRASSRYWTPAGKRVSRPLPPPE